MHRVRAALLILLGLVLAAGMTTAGWWQLEVYRRQGAEAAAARAAEPPRPLKSVAPPGSAVQDGYGRTVTATGAYERENEVWVPVAGEPGAYRKVTLFRLLDGRAVAVVRGAVRGLNPGIGADPRPQEIRGLLLPSEEASNVPPGPEADLGSVRIPQLAQRWPGPLVEGFITLSPDASRAQSLGPVSAALPEGRGRLRNGAYAFQWWLFAAFTVVMSIRIARDVARPPVAEAAPDPRLPSHDE